MDEVEIDQEDGLQVGVLWDENGLGNLRLVLGDFHKLNAHVKTNPRKEKKNVIRSEVLFVIGVHTFS